MIELKNSKTIFVGRTPDGRRRFSSTYYLHAVQMKEDGVWADIDPAIGRDNQPKYVPYEIEPFLDGMPGFHYVSKQSGEFVIRLRAARLTEASLSALTIARLKPPKELENGCGYIWKDFYPDTDIVLLYKNGGVSLRRILKSPNAPLVLDVDIEEVKVGIAKLVPIRPAMDALGQAVLMESKPILGGRTEILRLETIGAMNGQPIRYPIQDADDIDEQVGLTGNDGYSTSASGFDNAGDATVAGNWSTSYNAFALFTSVTIPSGQAIDADTHVSCHQYANLGTTPYTKIYANKTDTPTVPTDRTTHVAKVRTSEGVDWDGLWSAGWNDSPGISAVIQELYDDYDLSSGMDVQILHDPDGSGTDGALRGHTYDYGDNTYGMHLIINHTETGYGWSVETLTEVGPQKLYCEALSGSTVQTRRDMTAEGDQEQVIADMKVAYPDADVYYQHTHNHNGPAAPCVREEV